MARHSSCLTNPADELSFSNADNSEWNQKKQDMILNLGLTSQSETDQTPTPTRFIRNCEEVGLFQDLQNVNPFDEVFKKAVENPSGIHLQAPSNSDDTLHTPQIYPELEECPKFPCNNKSAPSSLSLNIDPTDDDDNPLIIVLEPDKENDKRDTREKLKAAIIEKSGGITPVPLAKLIEHKKDTPKINMAELLKQREANKAAQNRCRKRKRKEFEDTKNENKLLKQENVRLKSMNMNLQQIIKRLQEELEDAKSSTQNKLSSDKSLNNNTLKQYSPTISSNNQLATPVILNNLLQAPIQLPPIAPKNLVLALPMGLPLPKVQANSRAVVLVCPVAPDSVIVPSK